MEDMVLPSGSGDERLPSQNNVENVDRDWNQRATAKASHPVCQHRCGEGVKLAVAPEGGQKLALNCQRAVSDQHCSPTIRECPGI